VTLTHEQLAQRWEIKLIRTTNIDPNYLSQVAYILAQDELHGTDARTPAQIDLMGRAVDSRTKVR
jgi:hypothetical protein